MFDDLAPIVSANSMHVNNDDDNWGGAMTFPNMVWLVWGNQTDNVSHS